MTRDQQTSGSRTLPGALAKICRFGAQTKHFYSVAQHALLVRRLVLDAGHDDLELIALHHDSHEAFVGDLPTPLKPGSIRRPRSIENCVRASTVLSPRR
jgi:5'-deoxynucleotidase YfbR-like HD superfamily hydrolase